MLYVCLIQRIKEKVHLSVTDSDFFRQRKITHFSFSASFNFCSQKIYLMIIDQNLILAAKNIESFPPLSSIPSCLIDVNINIHKHRSPFSPPSLTFGLKCQGRKFEHGNAKNPKLLQKHLMMILSLINFVK